MKKYHCCPAYNFHTDIVATLTSTTTPGESVSGSNDKEGKSPHSRKLKNCNLPTGAV